MQLDRAEARFFNVTGTYNATTLATTAGAMLFVALNSVFVMMFLTPKGSKAKSSKQTEDSEYYEEYYDAEDFNYSEVKKRYLGTISELYGDKMHTVLVRSFFFFVSKLRIN